MLDRGDSDLLPGDDLRVIRLMRLNDFFFLSWKDEYAGLVSKA